MSSSHAYKRMWFLCWSLIFSTGRDVRFRSAVEAARGERWCGVPMRACHEVRFSWENGAIVLYSVLSSSLVPPRSVLVFHGLLKTKDRNIEMLSDDAWVSGARLCAASDTRWTVEHVQPPLSGFLSSSYTDLSHTTDSTTCKTRGEIHPYTLEPPSPPPPPNLRVRPPAVKCKLQTLRIRCVHAAEILRMACSAWKGACGLSVFENAPRTGPLLADPATGPS